MKIYIAAPWVRKADAIAAGKHFNAAGHVVTSRWFYHHGTEDDSTGSSMDRESVQRQAHEDIEDVLRADCLVVLNLEKSEGKAVETGIAIAAHIPIISVGPRSNIFQSLGKEVETVDYAIAYLATLL